MGLKKTDKEDKKGKKEEKAQPKKPPAKPQADKGKEPDKKKEVDPDSEFKVRKSPEAIERNAVYASAGIVAALFKELNLKGKTLLVTSHHDEVFQDAGLVYELERGRIVREDRRDGC